MFFCNAFLIKSIIFSNYYFLNSLTNFLWVYLVSRRCIPSIDGIDSILDQLNNIFEDGVSDLLKAISNIEILATINGVRKKKPKLNSKTFIYQCSVYLHNFQHMTNTILIA